MFHHPERSETKKSAPEGDHSGWKIDSPSPPATRRGPVTPPAPRSPVHSSHPSQGMFGWFHCSQHSREPSGLTRGLE